MSYDEEFDNFEMLDEEEQQQYFRDYVAEVERSAAGLSDSEKEALFDELNSKHNVRRSTNGAADGRRNFLEAEKSLRESDGSQDPAVQKFMEYIDKREGRPGAGKEKLRKALKMELPMGLRGKI